MVVKASAVCLALAAAVTSATAIVPRGGKSDGPIDCCSTLMLDPELEGKVFLKESAVYEARLESYYSANAALPAWCMVLPTHTDDVSAIAKILSKNQCPFGMRSGAHSAWAGSNAVKDGVTIDFAYFNETQYDEASKIVSIRPGANWGMVFDVLEPYDVTAVGGRADVVGVGGFTTGGGYSFHSGVRGLACDAVTGFEVVLADGSVVEANANERADLYKALKGGSGNFGFVTRVDQEIAEQKTIWGGRNGYDQSKSEEVFKAYVGLAENMGSDPASLNVVSLRYADDAYSLGAILTNIDADEEAPAFKEYRKIETSSSTTRVMPISEFVPEITGRTPSGLYAEWMTGMTSNDVRVLNFINKKHKEYSEKMKEAAPGSEFNSLVTFQPITKEIVARGQENGGNSLGLERVVADGPAIMWLIAVTADNAENQEKIHPLTMEFKAAVNEYATEIGANKDWEFLNYSYADQDPISTYGKKNIKALKKASKKYDPNGVFQKLRDSGFKLPQ